MDTLETVQISSVRPTPETSGKIFGIGAYKTGTSSLYRALSILGFRTFHDVLFYEQNVSKNPEARFPESILDEHDAFADHPFPSYFKEADQKYPNSKFILTIRDIDSWLKSIQEHVKRNQLNPFYSGTFNRFDEAKEIKRWHEHTEAVIDYFKDRPQDLLIMNIIEGDGWEPLCAFLNLPVPSIPFPHWNRRMSVPRHLMFELVRWLREKIKNENA